MQLSQTMSNHLYLVAVRCIQANLINHMHDPIMVTVMTMSMKNYLMVETLTNGYQFANFSLFLLMFL